MAVRRIVITVTHDDGTTGSVILNREPGDPTVITEYEPSIGPTARTIANALIATNLFRKERP